MLRDPILKVKELSSAPDADHTLDLFMKIFDIEEAVEEQKRKENSISLSSSRSPIDQAKASLQS
jgi:glutamyl-tRNA reductase